MFGVKKTVDVKTDEFNLVAIEDSKGHTGNADLTAAAYDIDGNILYTLGSEHGYWVWEKLQ